MWNQDTFASDVNKELFGTHRTAAAQSTTLYSGVTQ